jgi:hypothetical protein
VLKALLAAPVDHEEGKAPVDSEHRTTLEIPKSQFARIRTWVEYGMTAAQVAVVYDGSICHRPRGALQREAAAR